MAAKRITPTLVFILVGLLVATLTRTYAQGGPSFNVTFNPGSSAQVGQNVNIHVKVNATTYGASKITPSCGGVSKSETSELEYDSNWDTSGCQGGMQSVQVCSKMAADEQWMQGNCQNFAYSLTGSNSNIPTISLFGADTGNLQPGQCTTMHWRTSGASSVNIDGHTYSPNGDLQICPTVTTKYSLSAAGPNGTAYENFEVTVSTVPQTQNQGPTNEQANNSANVQSQPGRPTLAQAQQQGTSGGVDVVVYCEAKGLGGPSNAPDNSPNAAYSWKCGGVALGDFSQVCREVYGGDYRSQNVMGNNRLGGWRCVRNGSGTNNVPNNPPSSGCGPSPSRLHGGDIAVVSDYDADPLEVFNERDVRSGLKFTVPIREMVSIIQGASCAYGVTWVEVGYQGKGGWAVEVTSKGFYNLIPNGMSLPGPGGSNSGSSNPQNSGQQGNPSTNQTNAVGQPLIVLPNGDLVYPIAYGSNRPPASGSYIHVPGKYHSLYLRTTQVPDQTRKNVIGTMNPNDYYSVVQVGNGWIQVQTSLGVGWVSADYVELTTRNGQPVQTATVPPSQNQRGNQSQNQQEDPCEAYAYIGGIEGIALASWHFNPKSGGTLQQPTSTFWQCGVYVRTYLLDHYGFDMLNYNGQVCTSSPVKNWKDSASRCGLKVDHDIRSAQTGDIALWTENCGIAGDDGHVAVVLVPPSTTNDGKIEVTDANHVDSKTHQPDGQIYLDYKWPIAPCMYVIHTSLAFGNHPSQDGGGIQPGTGVASGSTTATSITWSFCIACTSHVWVAFTLPSGHYKLDGYRITFMGRDLPVVGTPAIEKGSSVDKVIFHIGADIVQQQINAGDGDKLNDVNNWRLFYTIIK